MALVSAVSKDWKPAPYWPFSARSKSCFSASSIWAPRRLLDGRVVGDVDHVLADADQRAAERQVVDRAAVVLGVDDGRRLRRQAGEIGGQIDVADGEVGRQEGLDGDRRGDLVGADELAGDLEDRLVHRLEEVLRLEEIGDPVEGFVVDQDGAEQRLLRLDVLWRGAIGLVGRVVGDRANRECHCCRSSFSLQRPRIASLSGVCRRR